MKSNRLLDKIYLIQDCYADLLEKLLPKLKSVQAREALDEINIFWYKNIDVVQLYLKTYFSGTNSYVFTAVTRMDLDDKEHLPFLLLSGNHVLDDSLSKYSEIFSKMDDSTDADYLYQEIGKTAEDNLNVLRETNKSILLFPLRLLNQPNENGPLQELGISVFLNLFDDDIKSMKDYFEKCSTLDNIIQHAAIDLNNVIYFNEDDDKTLDFKSRFERAIESTKFMINKKMSDAYNFMALVYGCIQQALDVIISCMEYHCFPYVRYSVAFHYISLILSNLGQTEEIISMNFRMSIAHIIHIIFDKSKFDDIDVDRYIKVCNEYDFSRRLFENLLKKGIHKGNFQDKQTIQAIEEELKAFYQIVT